MKKIIPLIIILFVFFLQFKAASFLHLLPYPKPWEVQEDQIDWESHFEKAWGRAIKEKKHLFLYFEKKNDPWCLKMQKEILDNPGFIQELHDRFIFVRLDAEEAEKEAFLFRVQEIPSVVLLHLQKQRMFSLGYLPFSGKKYAREIKKLFFHHRDSTEAFREMKQQNGELLVSQKALTCSKKGSSLFYNGRFFSSLLSHYAEVLQEHEIDSEIAKEKRKEIEDLDPRNHLELQLSLAFLEFHALSRKENPVRAIAPLLDYIDRFGKRKQEDLWILQMTISQFLSQKGEDDKALFFARASYRSAPLAIKKQLAETIRILKEKMVLSKGFPRDDVE